MAMLVRIQVVTTDKRAPKHGTITKAYGKIRRAVWFHLGRLGVPKAGRGTYRCKTAAQARKAQGALEECALAAKQISTIAEEMFDDARKLIIAFEESAPRR